MMAKQYIASLSYGKDSLAMLHVITDILKQPLDRIITADVWATDTIPADLPPMVEFKEKADRIIKERWGIEVEHVCAKKKQAKGLPTKACSIPRSEKPQPEGVTKYTQTPNANLSAGIGKADNSTSSDSRASAEHGATASLKSAHLKNFRKWSYQDEFYTVRKTGQRPGEIVGWPFRNGAWCNSTLKVRPIKAFSHRREVRWFRISG